MKKFLFPLLVALLLTSLSSAAFAGKVAGVTMAESAKVGDQDLALNGMALRSKSIFKVYVAGLYLPAKEGDWKAVLKSDDTRQLKMHWVRKVGKKKICAGWYDGLTANNPKQEKALKGDFDKLCTMMEDAKTGDQFVFTYTPEKGTSVKVAGKAKGTIEGKAFADALWACWIGPKPGPGVDFRDGLMGK